MRLNLNYTLVFGSLISVLIFIGGMFPYGFPLFTPLVFLYWFFIIIKQIDIRIGKWFFPYSIMLIIYCYPICLFGNLYLPNILDIINAISVMAFFVVLYTVIENEQDFDKYTSYFVYFSALTSTFIATIGLFKFGLMLNGIKFSFLYRQDGTYPWGTSLVSDYNIFTIGLFVGLFSICHLLKTVKSLIFKYILSIMASVVFLSLIFAGSRRAWIALAVVSFFYSFSVIRYISRVVLRILLVFRIKKAALVSIELAFLLFATVFIIYFNSFANFSIKYGYHLTNMSNRFVGLKDFANIQANPRSRMAHYEYAFDLYDQYPVINLVIGNGSEYMAKFGRKFGGETEFAYPHNPILSTFLQSGILGGLVVIFYIMWCYWLYLYCWAIHQARLFFAISLTSSWYYFVSGNSIFSSKIYIFFSLLMPWLVYKVHCKKRKSTDLKNNNMILKEV